MAREKKKLLIVEDNEEVRNILTMHIESEFNVELIFAESVKNAVEFLTANPKIELVIANYNFKGVLSSKIFKFIKAMNLETFFILLTQEYPKDDQWLAGFMVRRDKYKYLKFPVKEEEIVSLISEMLELKRPSKVEGHRRVLKNNIGIFVREKVDIWMIDNNQEYIKVIDDSVLKNQDDGRDQYYVKAEDYVEISEKITAALGSKLKSEKLNTSQKLNLQGVVVERIHESLTDLGLSSKEIELGEEVYKSSLVELKKSKRMSGLLSKMIQHKAYTQELALMCNYLSIAIVSKTSWYSELSMKKLAMAAQLQDISLQEDEYSRIQDLKAKKFLSYSDDVQHKIKNHPNLSAKLIDGVADIGDLSNNIRDIIISHHERPHGDGFPKGIDASAISGLSSVFIIAHEFSRVILDQNLTVEVLQEMKKNLEKNYSHGRFRKPYEAFLEIFKKGVGKI